VYVELEVVVLEDVVLEVVVLEEVVLEEVLLEEVVLVAVHVVDVADVVVVVVEGNVRTMELATLKLPVPTPFMAATRKKYHVLQFRPSTRALVSFTIRVRILSATLACGETWSRGFHTARA